MLHAHGEFNFKVESDILILEGRGPWNVEAISRSPEVESEFQDKLYGNLWGVICIFYGDPILIPEAVDILIKDIVRDRVNGRAATALILEKQESSKISLTHISQILSTAGEPFKQFDHRGEAEKWLRSMIDQ